MLIDTSDIPRVLLERIGAAAPSPAIFVADELADWPHGVAEALVGCELLQMGTRAASVVCDGCEWHCVKSVVVRAAPNQDDRAQIFVVCDEEPDLGRIAIAPQRLLRHSATLLALASFVARALNHDRPLERNGSFLLGSISGRYGPKLTYVGVKDREVRISVGNLSQSLIELLSWRDGTLALDNAGV
jgi:hypothetical protein